MVDLVELDPHIHDDPRVAALARCVDLLAKALGHTIEVHEALAERLDAIEEHLDLQPSPPLSEDVHVRDDLL